jgi:hypothetical protein
MHGRGRDSGLVGVRCSRCGHREAVGTMAVAREAGAAVAAPVGAAPPGAYVPVAPPELALVDVVDTPAGPTGLRFAGPGRELQVTIESPGDASTSAHDALERFLLERPPQLRGDAVAADWLRLAEWHRETAEQVARAVPAEVAIVVDQEVLRFAAAIGGQAWGATARVGRAHLAVAGRGLSPEELQLRRT